MRSKQDPAKTRPITAPVADSVVATKAITGDHLSQAPKQLAPLTAAPTAESPRIKQLNNLQTMANNYSIKNISGVKPIQMAVSRSGIYTTAAANRTQVQAEEITQAWNELDALVPEAEQNATEGVQEQDPANRTPTQNAFVQNNSAALWGSCVEEQLNELAENWDQQVPLANSRPDYRMNAGGIDTYADLTTVAQAGVAGDHITEKLQRSHINAGQAVAADITYGGQQAQPAQMEDWRLAAFGAKQLHDASVNGNGDGEYNEWAEENEVPDNETIWGWSQEECVEYTTNVHQNIHAGDQFEEEDDLGEGGMDIEDD